MTASPNDTRPASNAPRAAATILLLREAGAQVEVLMVRRHANLAFMAGMWVFPGGSLHASDMSPEALAMFDGESIAKQLRLRDLQGELLPAAQIAGLAFAACRETFEEAGVLLARHVDGSPCDAAVIARLQQHRDAVNADATLFVPLLEAEGLRPDTSALMYWAHWITPSSSPRRFDTRFFAVRAPLSQLASADASETVESCWMTPADLLAAAACGEMPISHPTQCNLHDLHAALQRHGSLTAFLDAEAARRVCPIVPKMFREADHSVIVMPWDATYEASPGEGPGLTAGECGALAELPSRVIV